MSNILEMRKITKAYRGVPAVREVDFDLRQGEIRALLGENGAGKSTVFKAIFGLLKLREGRVILKGQDVTGFSQRQLLAAGMCYVPQGRNIFPQLSVRHNIELGAVAAGRSIGDIPRRIEDALDRFPALRKKATQQASTLSGGEQKQLEIVRGIREGEVDREVDVVLLGPWCPEPDTDIERIGGAEPIGRRREGRSHCSH